MYVCVYTGMFLTTFFLNREVISHIALKLFKGNVFKRSLYGKSLTTVSWICLKAIVIDWPDDTPNVHLICSINSVIVKHIFVFF